MSETILVTRDRLERISTAIRAIGSENNKVDLDGNETWNLSKDGDIVERELRIFIRAKTAIMKKHGVVQNVKYGPDKAESLRAALDEIEQLEDGECQLAGILLLDRKKFSRIQPGTLIDLLPLLKESPPAQ